MYNIGINREKEVYVLGTDDYYGKEQAEKYSEMIYLKLGGHEITKKISEAEKKGGLRYEADRLGIDMYDLLKALEGMCHRNEACEIEDGTYLVYPFR